MKVSLGWHKDTAQDVRGLAQAYEAHGVEVVVLGASTPDATFHRDVFAWTPGGLIKCRMGKASRSHEPDEWFEAMGTNPTYTIKAPGTFEGADLLWVKPGYAILGVGRRTDWHGALQVGTVLAHQGVEVLYALLPPWHDQHLLGMANACQGVVWAFAGGLWSPVRGLLGASLPPGDYGRKGSNWVCVADSRVLLGNCCHGTCARLATAGIDTVCVGISQLLAHGGGVACATGIIEPGW